MGRKHSANLNLPPQMRARKRGDKVYYFYDTGGRPRREISLGSDYVMAVQKWSELHVADAPVLPTVGYAIAKYLSSAAFSGLASGTQADYRFALDKIAEHFAPAPLDQVTPVHLTKYLALRGAESKHRAQREVAVLGMIFRFARSIGLTTNNPKESVQIKRLPGRKHVYISDTMLDALYDQACQPLKDAIDLAYCIGQRPADVLALSSMNIEDGAIEYRQGKTGTPQRIMIAGPLKELIDRIEQRKKSYRVHSLFLLVDERGNKMTKAKLRGRFEKARAAAGIAGKDFQFRDLRRKSGTDLRDQRGIEAAQDLLGHASITMTEHYTGARGKRVAAIPTRKRPKT